MLLQLNPIGFTLLMVDAQLTEAGVRNREPRQVTEGHAQSAAQQTANDPAVGDEQTLTMAKLLLQARKTLFDPCVKVLQ